MFEKLVVWSKLTLKQRYNLLIAAIIVVMGTVIRWQDSQHRIYVRECRSEKTMLRDRIDEAKNQQLLYFQQMSSDYLIWLNQLNKIKNESNESKGD